MASGVVLGAYKPSHVLTLKSFNPTSTVVGTLGADGVRCRDVTNGPRALPAFASGNSGGHGSI